MSNHHNPKTPSISPAPGNANSIFFAGTNTGLGTNTDRSLSLNGSKSRSRSSSPNKNIPNIIVDPADGPKEHFTSDKSGKSSPILPRKSKSREVQNYGNEKGGVGARKSRKDIHTQDQSTFHKTYIGRSYEYDRELIRRQHAMIAIQPMTGLEEIEYKRNMLRMKVENRRRADGITTPRSRATTSLGILTPSNPVSRSPSPARLSMDKTKNDFHISKKLADATSQAIKVTKKVSNINKKLTPKINAKGTIPKK